MTVKELIQILQTKQQSDIVIMSKDAEGNSYRPLAEVYNGAYLEGEQVQTGTINSVSAVVLYPEH